MPGLTRAGQVAAAMALGGALVVGSASAQTMIVGNDEKVTFDENNKSIPHEPGHDTLSVVDVSKPDAPVVAATIPLHNTVAGPPVNLAIHPSGEFALVANSVNPERGRRQVEKRSGRQGLCRRSEGEPAENRRHGQYWKAALGSGDLA